MYKIFYSVGSFILFLITLAISSCMDEDALREYEVQCLIEEGFDFRTSTTVPVSIDLGYKTLVKVYEDYPIPGKDVTCIYSAFTSKDGFYKGEMTIPSFLVGELLYVEVENEVFPVEISKSGLIINSSNLTWSNSRALADPDDELSIRLKNEFFTRLPENQNNAQNELGTNSDGDYTSDDINLCLVLKKLD